MSATDANKDFALGQKGTSFEVKPTNNDDPNNVIPLDLTDYESAKIRIRQPNGKISTHEAVVTGASETTSLIGLRIDDPSQTIDDTHINDGNDGTLAPESTQTLSGEPISNFDPNSYIEIPPGVTAVCKTNSFRSDDDPYFYFVEAFVGTVSLTGLYCK